MMKKLIICRTDGIGDVVLTLPIAGLMKQAYPGLKICFIGRSYTAPVVAACEHVDEFLDRDGISDRSPRERVEFFRKLQADAIVHVFPDKELARLAWQSGIPVRIGTSHRFRHWMYCNRLVHLGRKRSPLHEAQLNSLLLRPLGIKRTPALDELASLTGLNRPVKLDEALASLLHPDKFNLILHPTSKGSAREWGFSNFCNLVRLLPPDRYEVFVTGTAEEGMRLRPLFEELGARVHDMTGKLPLDQFIAFIGAVDGLVAASTGPLHISAALGRVTVGLYAPMRPIHPGRWAPLGPRATYLVADRTCSRCRHETRCECIESISPADVLSKLEQLSGTFESSIPATFNGK